MAGLLTNKKKSIDLITTLKEEGGRLLLAPQPLRVGRGKPEGEITDSFGCKILFKKAQYTKIIATVLNKAIIKQSLSSRWLGRRLK